VKAGGLQITKFALPIFVLPDYVKFTSAYKFPKLPLHIIKGLSHVISEFMAWLSGFTDAEGSFSIVCTINKLLNFSFVFAFIKMIILFYIT
jgi:hypothetical protein